MLAVAAIATVRVLELDRTHLVPWLTSAPVVTAFLSGNTTLFIALALALAWRFRDRTRLVVAGVATAATLKLWPIALVTWLWLSGRRRAASSVLTVTAAAIFGPWAAIGFRGLTDYPAMLSDMSHQFARNGSWLITWLVETGLPYRAASGIALLAAAVLVGVAALRIADRARFSLVTAAGITATATPWLHYFCLLVLPFSGLSWLLLPALWIPLDAARVFGHVLLQESGRVLGSFSLRVRSF